MRLLLLLTPLIHSCVGLNILFYLVAVGKSHVDFTDSLIDSLVEKGHTVDLILARFNPLVKGNGKSRADRIYTYGFQDGGNWTKSPHLVNPFTETPFVLFGKNLFIETAVALCEIGLQDTGLVDFLNYRKYDVGIASDYDFCGHSYFHHWGIPSMATVNAIPIVPGQGSVQGLPNPASVTSLVLEQYDLDTFVGRVKNLLQWGANTYSRIPMMLDGFVSLTEKSFKDQLFLKYYGPHFPSSLELSENVDLLFINANEIIDRPRSISHKFQYIGGINKREAKRVSPAVSEILNSAQKANVLFCFGTQVPSENFPREVKKGFIDAFRQFPEYNFIWKYERQPGDEQLFSNASNVITMEWIPQNDLLNDARVVAFISHMGLNSYLETSFAGKPTLAVPLFFDQLHNSVAANAKGTSYIVSRTEVTAENVARGLKQVLGNSSYTTSARMIQKMLLNNPIKAKTSFVNWVEFIAQNPGYHKVLEMPGRRMSPFLYYSLDVIVFLALFFTSIFYLSYWLLRYSIRYQFKTKIE